MEFESLFSSSGSRLKSSKIRELMKLIGDPEIISMAGGIPDAEHFPFEQIRSIIDSWDKAKRAAALQYGATSGYPPLVEMIGRYEAALGVCVEGQAVLPTTGAQQANGLVSQVLCDPGDVVVVELPTFIGTLAAFASQGVRPVGVPMDEEGLIPGILEQTLGELKSRGVRAKYLYTIPTFQNPAGLTMTQARRDQVYAVCRDHDLPIVEDDPYHELYFSGSPADYLSLKSRDTDNRVIKISTFSKILSPGLRLGWIIGPPEVVTRCELAKQSLDACSSSFSQVVAADYLAAGYVRDYTSKMRPIYGGKCSLMLECLAEQMPGQVSWSKPSGGFFIWVTLPERLDSEELFVECLKEKVAFVTGSPFHVDGKGRNKLRLSFSNSSREQIIEGIRRLAGVVRRMIRQS